MFDFGMDELVFTTVVAIVVIGPKDMPRALRTAGRWIGKVRRVSGHFRSGIETMIREAELEEMEKKWREQNAAIMAAHPDQTPDTDSAAATEAATHEPEALPKAAPAMEPLTTPEPPKDGQA